MRAEVLANEFLKWFRDGGDDLRYLGLDPLGRPLVGDRDRPVSDAQLVIWVQDWIERTGRGAWPCTSPAAIATAVRVQLVNFNRPL